MRKRSPRGPYAGRKEYTISTKANKGLPLTVEERLAFRASALIRNTRTKALRMATVAGRAHSLWMDARRRAKIDNLPFSITEAWVIAKLNTGRCEKTDIEFDLSRNDSRVNKYSPSLDQMVSGDGYTFENCRCVVWLYNTAKHEYSDQELLEFAAALLRKAGVLC